MSQAVRKGRQNRHEKITVLLLSGKPVSPAEIHEVFKGTDQEKVLYRLSTNIYNIRKDGGVIKVHKNGRTVAAYQLMNPEDFDSNGRFLHKKHNAQNTPIVVTVVNQTEAVAA
jgi:hypothetical protein